MKQSNQLRLKDLPPLAQGSYRNIYQHPHDANLLVKVLGPRAHTPTFRWYKPWRQFTIYRTLKREVREYRALEKRGLVDLPFLQKFHGIVDTDLGWGISVSKIMTGDGKLAPTLVTVVKERGLNGDLRGKLLALRDQIIGHAIVFMDVHGENIVVTPDEKLVVIDGLGDRLLIPVNALNAAINRRNIMRYFKQTIRQLEDIDRRRP